MAAINHETGTSAPLRPCCLLVRTSQPRQGARHDRNSIAWHCLGRRHPRHCEEVHQDVPTGRQDCVANLRWTARLGGDPTRSNGSFVSNSRVGHSSVSLSFFPPLCARRFLTPYLGRAPEADDQLIMALRTGSEAAGAGHAQPGATALLVWTVSAGTDGSV